MKNKRFPTAQKSILLSLIMLLTTPFTGFAQEDTLKNQIKIFENSLASQFEKEFLNIASRDLGGIDDTDFEWSEEFMLEAKEKKEDQLGSRKRFKYFFKIFKYQTIKDRQYALQYWLDNFIEGETLRPGRDKRSLRYATPTIILINPTNIVICSFNCRYYDYDEFDVWKDRLLEHFETDETMVIEILCDGPVEWTKRAPDPKTRGLF